jgi:hypothetical protein
MAPAGATMANVKATANNNVANRFILSSFVRSVGLKNLYLSLCSGLAHDHNLFKLFLFFLALKNKNFFTRLKNTRFIFFQSVLSHEYSARRGEIAGA